MSEERNDLDLNMLSEAARVCACSNFRKASRAVTQLFDTMLQPVGLRSTQLVILLGVAVHEPVSIASLARELVLDRTTLRRNLNPLEKAGLVQFVHPPESRTSLVELTSKGRQMLSKSVPLWHRAQTRFVEAVGEKKWKELREGLEHTVRVTRTS